MDGNMIRHNPSLGALSAKSRQAHFWLSESDHAYLAAKAVDGDESIGSVVRRLIRRARMLEGPVQAGPKASLFLRSSGTPEKQA